MNAFISVHIKKDAHLFIFCNTYFCHDLVIIKKNKYLNK